MIDEYTDSDVNYSAAEALIEEIFDQFHMRGYIYMECDNYNNVSSCTVMKDDDDGCDRFGTDVQFDALINLVLDILDGRDEDDRNAAIVDIYNKIFEAIHIEEDDDLEEDAE